MIAYGLSEPRFHNFPEPVGKRFVVNCDIPDHALFIARYPTLKKLRFGSCIDIPGLAQVLSMMSHAVQKKWIKNWSFLSSFIVPFMNALKFLGSAHSGFFLRCAGSKGNENKQVLFEIIALNGSGLEIPVTPVVMLVKKMISGERLPVGAYPCMGLFSLDEFERELSSYPISFHWKMIS